MYRSPIAYEELKALATKNNWAATWRTGLHMGLLIGTGTLATLCVQHQLYWALLPALMLHGMVFSFLGYAGMGHELYHNTVFSNPRINQGLFKLVSLLTWNNPVYFRHSHSTHHKHTLEAGLDFEVSPKPYPLLEQWWRYAFFDFTALKRSLVIFWDNAHNEVKGPLGERIFRRGKPERQALVHTARQHIALHATLALAFIGSDNWLLLALITFANFFCTLPNRILAKLQHSGKPINSDDYRENSRTVLLPAWLAFLYWNMNYHIEHHMYPSVPCYNLPTLRQTMKADLPEQEETLLPNLKHIRMPKVKQ
jgi:fatty acid desaturase